MASRLRKHYPILKELARAKPKVRRKILRAASIDLVRCLCECSHNILRGNLKLSPKQKKKLKHHSKTLRSLAGKKVGLKRKKKLILQKGGFLPALLTPILGIASSLIGNLLNQ